jgi:hypothetical protein
MWSGVSVGSWWWHCSISLLLCYVAAVVYRVANNKPTISCMQLQQRQLSNTAGLKLKATTTLVNTDVKASILNNYTPVQLVSVHC